MFWPLIQISPICPSGNSDGRLGIDDDGPFGDTDLARRSLGDGLRRIVGHLDEAVPVFSSSRSTEMIFGGSLAGVVDTNSVASARP